MPLPAHAPVEMLRWLQERDARRPVDPQAMPSDVVQPLNPSLTAEAFEARLTELQALPRGWHPYNCDSEPIAAAVVDDARDLAETVGLPENVVPLDDGGLQLEWSGPGGLLEVETHPDGQRTCLLGLGPREPRTYQEWEHVGVGHVLQLRARLG